MGVEGSGRLGQALVAIHLKGATDAHHRSHTSKLSRHS